jgi:PAS domain S-box-containing protein
LNILSILHFIAFISYLYLGIATYRLDKQSIVNRIMLLLCCFLALWALAYGFMHGTEDRQIAHYWHMVSAIGWNMLIPMLLNLCLLMARRGRYLNIWNLFIMYVPAVAAIIIADIFMLNPGMLHRVSFGWSTVYDKTYPPVWLFMAGYIIYFGTGMWALIIWGRKSRYKREKKQMRIILISLSISITLAVITDNILPVLGITVIPIMGPLMGMVWVIGQWVAIKKYRLMTIGTSFAASEIIKSMKDLMVLVNYRGIISQVSPHTCEILDYDAADLNGMPIDILVSEKKALAGELRLFIESGRENSIFDIHFRKKNGGTIPVRMSGSALHDGDGDLLGIVFVGYDLRETTKLIEMQSSIDQDMEMAAHVQAGMLPAKPPVSDDWDLFFIFNPVTPVSGDFYDFYESGGALQGVSLFDVSGHGVSAGLITMIAKSIVFRVFKNSERFPLNNLLEKVNEELVKEIGNLENFLTGIILRFRGNTVEYVNGGHTQLLCKRASDGSVSIINRDDMDFRGPFLGVPDMVTKFKMLAFTVATGDQILIYSDALIEARREGKNHYGLSRLMEAFKNAPLSASEETADFIMQDVRHFLGDKPFRDDLTVILMTRK